jgi:hypothetical protein
MYGLTRGTITLLGAGVAGLLVWLATQVNEGTNGGYWSVYGLLAAAGLTMAFSQILGGWTKWGWPRLSIAVLTTAFVPVAIVSLWIVLAGEPGSGWFHNHVLAWSRDIHVSGLVTDFLYYIPVLVFGTGLVFGFSFDTTGPVVRDRDVTVNRDRETAPINGRAADEPVTAEREAAVPSNDRITDRETVR